MSSILNIIISATVEAPRKYRHMFVEITEENLLRVLLDTSSYSESSLFEEVSDRQLQEIVGFTSNQLDFLRLSSAEGICRFLAVKQALGERDNHVYQLIIDKEQLEENQLLADFVYGSIILDERETEMKIRDDFVTNSSSSSFLISKKWDCEKSQIEETLKQMKGDIAKWLLVNNMRYDDEALKYFISQVTDRLFYYPSCLKANDWEESIVCLANDTNDMIQVFIYENWRKLSSKDFTIKDIPT